MVLNLVKLKQWSIVIFITLILSAIFIEIPFVIILEKESIIKGFREWFFIMFFWVSLILIPVFGISALIRKIVKKKAVSK